jgi:hypothetical protein
MNKFAYIEVIALDGCLHAGRVAYVLCGDYQ